MPTGTWPTSWDPELCVFEACSSAFPLPSDSSARQRAWDRSATRHSSFVCSWAQVGVALILHRAPPPLESRELSVYGPLLWSLALEAGCAHSARGSRGGQRLLHLSSQCPEA